MVGMFSSRLKRVMDSSSDDEGDGADNVDIFRHSTRSVKRWQAAEERAKAQKRMHYLQERKDKEKAELAANSREGADTEGQRAEAQTAVPAVDSIEVPKPLSPSRSVSPTHTSTSSRQTPRKTRARLLAFEDDSDDDIVALVSPSKSPSKAKQQPEDKNTADSATVDRKGEDDSDAEIRELAARSRARKAAEEAEKLNAGGDVAGERSHEPLQSHPPSAPVPTAATDGAIATMSARSRTGTPLNGSSTQAGKDPIVSIFIHSRIPNTRPLIINRRISQSLKAVRVSYCRFNNLPPEMERSAFLTWRRRRLFDITNCRSIGIDVDASGDVFIKGERVSSMLGSGEADDNGIGGAKLEMELTTQELFQADRLEREARLQGSAMQAGYPPLPRTDTQQKAPEQERKIKIILRSRGYAEYKLGVRPSTRFQQIVDVFRKQRRVPAEAEVALMFDGERLLGEATVGTTEIDDLDYVDVHVK